MMKRIAVVAMLVVILCCAMSPALADRLSVKNGRMTVFIKDEVYLDPCEVKLNFSFDNKYEGFFEIHDLHIYYPGGDKALRNVSRRTTGVCSVDIMLTRAMIEAGKFDVSCTYTLYSPATDRYAGEYTDSVTIELTTAENAFDRWVQNLKRDLAQSFWTIILLICVLIAIASIGGGEIIGIIFWR